MSLYVVTSKATGEEVYRYQSDVPIDITGMGFVTHYHTAVVESDLDGVIEGVASRGLTKREFIKRFTVEEYSTIKATAANNATLDYYWQMFMLAEEIVTDDPDTIAGVTMLEQVGLIGVGRAQEILNGN